MKDIDAIAGLEIPLSGIMFVMGVGLFLLLKTIKRVNGWFDLLTLRCGQFYSSLCILAAVFSVIKIVEVQQNTTGFIIVNLPHTIPMVIVLFIGLPFLLFAADIGLQKLKDIIPEAMLRMLYLLEITTIQILSLWIASLS